MLYNQRSLISTFRLFGLLSIFKMLHLSATLPSSFVVALSILEPCGPLGVGGDLSVFPGGAVTLVGFVGVPLPPTVVGVNITGLSVLVCLYGTYM